ncbi:hypothetical protein [Brazilian porcupinepox virus 1]|nr:hypothetical protein [Brazilian porcupinepox virus 1]
MTLRDRVFNILVEYGAKQTYLENDHEYKEFVMLCKEFIKDKRSKKVANKIKCFLKNIPKSIIYRVWLPVSLYCDQVTSHCVYNKEWTSNQVNMMNDDTSMYNMTSYGNLAKVIVTYPNDKNGERVLKLINLAMGF